MVKTSQKTSRCEVCRKRFPTARNHARFCSGRCRTLAYRARHGAVTRAPSQARDAWYTPALYVETVRRVLGSIELDPFSSPEANKVVGAERYFTQAEDAFTCDWTAATLFMNPPYGAQVVAHAVNRLVDDVAAGRVASAVLLVNNASETRWFQRALTVADALCLPSGRIQFWNTDGKQVSSNMRPQVFLLFGLDRVDTFREYFNQHGMVATL